MDVVRELELGRERCICTQYVLCILVRRFKECQDDGFQVAGFPPTGGGARF